MIHGLYYAEIVTRGEKSCLRLLIYSQYVPFKKALHEMRGGVPCKYGGHFGFSASDARFSLFLTLSSREVLLGVYRGFVLVLQTLEIAK